MIHSHIKVFKCNAKNAYLQFKKCIIWQGVSHTYLSWWHDFQPNSETLFLFAVLTLTGCSLYFCLILCHKFFESVLLSFVNKSAIFFFSLQGKLLLPQQLVSTFQGLPHHHILHVVYALPIYLGFGPTVWEHQVRIMFQK